MTTIETATSLNSSVTLNDGVQMPMFGMGVWRCSVGEETENVCLKALSEGYRMIDTARMYGNEEEVGRAVKRSDLKREDIFVVSKLSQNDHGAGTTCKEIEASVKKMDIGYIDLFLIHIPIGGKVLETYDDMISCQKKGLIRSVGVSNFGIHHLEGLRKAGKQTPSVNQIELHPWMHRGELVKYCRDNGITVMGWSPIAKGKRTDDEEITKIAKKYNRSNGQLMIRWSVQKGFITIPKSSKPERIVENKQVFDFSISDEDMETVENFQKWSCVTFEPDDMEWMP